MNQLTFNIIELFIKYESLAPNTICDLLGVSHTSVHNHLKKLHEKKIIRYDNISSAQRIINSQHPVILKYKEILAVVPEYQTKLTILSKKNLRSVFNCFYENKILTRKELSNITGLSLFAVRNALDKLQTQDLIQMIEGRPNRYKIKPLAKNKLLLDFNALLMDGYWGRNEMPMTYDELIDLLIKNKKVHVLVHHGSTQWDMHDEKSDIDLFLVISDRETLNMVKSISCDPKIELNPILIENLPVLVKKEPNFVSHLLLGKVLKGSHILESIAGN